MSAATTLNTRPSSVALSSNPPNKDPSIIMTPHIHSSPSDSLRQPSPSPNQRLRPINRRHTSAVADEFAPKPRDLEKHRRLPYFLQVEGSIAPRMIIPLLFVAIWSTIITCVSHFKYQLNVSDVLLTVLGFVVGLGISFRTSSAYERYVEGRKYWAQLIQTSRDLARHIWIHAKERHGDNVDLGKADLLAKMTALNLIHAFAVSLKYRLRFEPYTNYQELDPLVGHLSTFAGAASDRDIINKPEQRPFISTIGPALGLEFLNANPRKHIKRATKEGKQLGNLPLEILHYLSAYVDAAVDSKAIGINGAYHNLIMANLASMNEVLAGTERVVNTPLPLAYSIAISQITWVYVLALPFQLWSYLHWVTIPGTVVGAYIILGIAAIGREIENPFGEDDNDLPLDQYCDQIRDEINVISSKEKPSVEDFIATGANQPLFSIKSFSPGSFGTGYEALKAKSTKDIRADLRTRATVRATATFPPLAAEKGAQGLV